MKLNSTPAVNRQPGFRRGDSWSFSNLKNYERAAKPFSVCLRVKFDPQLLFLFNFACNCVWNSGFRQGFCCRFISIFALNRSGSGPKSYFVFASGSNFGFRLSPATAAVPNFHQSVACGPDAVALVKSCEMNL